MPVQIRLFKSFDEAPKDISALARSLRGRRMLDHAVRNDAGLLRSCLNATQGSCGLLEGFREMLRVRNRLGCHSRQTQAMHRLTEVSLCKKSEYSGKSF